MGIRGSQKHVKGVVSSPMESMDVLRSTDHGKLRTCRSQANYMFELISMRNLKTFYNVMAIPPLSKVVNFFFYENLLFTV